MSTEISPKNVERILQGVSLGEALIGVKMFFVPEIGAPAAVVVAAGIVQLALIETQKRKKQG